MEVEPEVKLAGTLAVILKSGDVEPAKENAVVEMEMQETAKLSTNTISRILPSEPRTAQVVPRRPKQIVALAC